MNGNEGHWGGGISTVSQNFPKSPSILFYPLESSISQTSPNINRSPSDNGHATTICEAEFNSTMQIGEAQFFFFFFHRAQSLLRGRKINRLQQSRGIHRRQPKKIPSAAISLFLLSPSVPLPVASLVSSSSLPRRPDSPLGALPAPSPSRLAAALLRVGAASAAHGAHLRGGARGPCGGAPSLRRTGRLDSSSTSSGSASSTGPQPQPRPSSTGPPPPPPPPPAHLLSSVGTLHHSDASSVGG
jgi:hypothetical protein